MQRLRTAQHMWDQLAPMHWNGGWQAPAAHPGCVAGLPPLGPTAFCHSTSPPLLLPIAAQSVNFHYVNWPEEQWVGGACEPAQPTVAWGCLWVDVAAALLLCGCKAGGSAVPCCCSLCATPAHQLTQPVRSRLAVPPPSRRQRLCLPWHLEGVGQVSVCARWPRLLGGHRVRLQVAGLLRR